MPLTAMNPNNFSVVDDFDSVFSFLGRTVAAVMTASFPGMIRFH